MNIILSLKRVAMLACVAALSVFQSQAQSTQSAQNSQDVKFRYPLDVTMSLSGNYGELRSNHFHGGIDFRVGGEPIRYIHNRKNNVEQKAANSPVCLRIATFSACKHDVKYEER